MNHAFSILPYCFPSCSSHHTAPNHALSIPPNHASGARDIPCLRGLGYSERAAWESWDPREASRAVRLRQQKRPAYLVHIIALTLTHSGSLTKKWLHRNLQLYNPPDIKPKPLSVWSGSILPHTPHVPYSVAQLTCLSSPKYHWPNSVRPSFCHICLFKIHFQYLTFTSVFYFTVPFLSSSSPPSLSPSPPSIKLTEPTFQVQELY